MYVLASASPRRAELLSRLGIRFETETSGFDETCAAGKTPEEYVLAAAKGKAEAVSAKRRGSGDVVISADTAVVLDGDILGKPAGEDDAVRMLMRLSGRTHTVFTGVCVTNGEKTVSFVNGTQVDFLPLSEAEAVSYAATGEPADKAGAYGIQGAGGIFVKGIRGNYTSVMGLPLAQTAAALREFGFVPFENNDLSKN